LNKVLVVRPFPAVWEFETYRYFKDEFEVDFIITQQLRNIDEMTRNTYIKFVMEDMKQFNIIALPMKDVFNTIRNSMLFKKLVSFRFTNFDTDVYFPLIRYLKRNNEYKVVDVVENYNFSSLQAVISKIMKITNSKIVVTNWENLVFPPWRFSFRYLVNLYADAFRVPSKSAAYKLVIERVDYKKIHYIPPSVNVNHFRPMNYVDTKSRLGLTNKIVIMYVGRLIKAKGIDTLLKAFYILKKKFQDNLSLVIIGEGPYKSYLEILSEKLNISRNVHFLGPHSHSEMPIYYNIADIVVLPSIPTKNWVEQFGFVLIEAMSCGKPIVASNSGAIPEVVKNNFSGLLFKPGDFKELAEKIKYLVENEDVRINMGRFGRDFVVRNFSHEVIAPRIEKFYRNLVE